MNEAILPTYLPAVAVTFTKKGSSKPIHIFRPYESIPIAELKQRADKEEIGALLQLGQRCFYGSLGAEQDYEAAYVYLKRAAMKGAQDAQFLLAAYYVTEEIGMYDRDAKKALQMLSIAANGGSWRAMERLAMAYRSGKGGAEVDHEQAFIWTEQAERMIRIYWQFYTQENFIDFNETLKELMRAHLRVCFMLASCHADGVGTVRDLDAALRCIENGEKFACKATGLAKIPMYAERRAELLARQQKDAARTEAAEKEAKKKK
ncbi:MAG: hypothetical protein MJ065_08590 [Oscillospiraceae bacterium]|nr:hypothetical protein [Oscillospiraceae bacterium]